MLIRRVGKYEADIASRQAVWVSEHVLSHAEAKAMFASDKVDASHSGENSWLLCCSSSCWAIASALNASDLGLLDLVRVATMVENGSSTDSAQCLSSK